MSTRVRLAGPTKKISSRVRPGVLDVRARTRRPVSALIRLDLPTLERPANATSTPSIGGNEAIDPAAALNCHSPANNLRPMSLMRGLRQLEVLQTVTLRRSAQSAEPRRVWPELCVRPSRLARYARSRLRTPVRGYWFLAPDLANSALMLSNSSILAPFLRMITLCWITDSVLFQAQ